MTGEGAVEPAIEAIERWLRGQRRQPTGSLREVFVGKWKSTSVTGVTNDASMPLRPAAVGA